MWYFPRKVNTIKIMWYWKLNSMNSSLSLLSIFESSFGEKKTVPDAASFFDDCNKYVFLLNLS